MYTAAWCWPVAQSIAKCNWLLPQVLLSQRDQASRLQGLALVLHGKFNAVGWPYMDAELMPLVGTGAVHGPGSCSCACNSSTYSCGCAFSSSKCS
jgi:hypothetical protein